MSTKKPEPYAPDLFSEHARLAQLGARVVEILRERMPFVARFDAASDEARCLDEMGHTYKDTVKAARSLGLLGEEARQ